MLHTEKAALLPARDTRGFVFIKNIAVVAQNQNNFATNWGGYVNSASAGGYQSVVVIQH